MFRIASVFVAVMALVLLVPATVGAAPPDEIPVGGKVEGELGEKNSDNFYGYFAIIPVSLKAGQTITINASVIGKDRVVKLRLLDPTKQPLTEIVSGTKNCQVTVEEVPATGKYLITVGSSRIGPFTLRTSTPPMNEADRKKLEEKLKELKKEVAEIEAQLKGSAAKPEK